MAKLLYYGTCGSNDPTKAVFPFLFGTTVEEAGHEVEVVVIGEAVFLMEDGLAATTHAVGLPTADELMKKAAKLGVPTSDVDRYLRPKIHYKIGDHWSAEIGGNVFLGTDDHTFFGQFAKNSNVYAGVRYSF